MFTLTKFVTGKDYHELHDNSQTQKRKKRKCSSCHADQDQLLPDVPVYSNASAAESESSGTHDHQVTRLTLKATNGRKPELSKAWQVLDMSHE